MFDAVALCVESTRDCAQAWQALEARARELTLQPQDAIEILELKGLSLARSGSGHEGRQAIDQAQAEADRSVRMMLRRIEHCRESIA